MKKAEVKTLREEEWQVEEDLVLKKGKMYVSKDKALRIEIIWLHHGIPIVGYEGKWKMMGLVTRNYWWPGITKDIRKYIEDCDMC